MTDRRERVLDAIDTALHDDTPIVVIVARHAGEYDWDTLLDRVADAAIAAMTAEPTDAEVEAGARAIWDNECIKDPRDGKPVSWDTTNWPETKTLFRAMRAALIAARKVSQP
jgi:hypothetical protein